MKITINNSTYDFAFDFKHETLIRSSFNALAKATFDFDFENYYKSGYWNERYIPYALLDGGKVIANVSANILDFSVLGESKRYIQIGTVMTDIAYRNQGLSKFLIKSIIHDWQDKSDMIYLFANDSVLDFYPKFGFTQKSEYQYTKKYKKEAGVSCTDKTAHNLNMDNPKNRELLFCLADNTLCFSKLSAMHNTSLVMFYATSFMKDSFYFIEDLDTAVLAEYKDNALYLNDIFSTNNILLDEIIFIMSKPETNKVVLGFTPADTSGYTCTPYFEGDNTLFVLAKDKSIFDKHKLMMPILSHA